LHLSIPRLHSDNGQNQRQRDRIGDNDGRRSEHQAVCQPKEYPCGECKEHAPGEIVAAFTPPRLMRLRDKGQRSQRARHEAQDCDRLHKKSSAQPTPYRGRSLRRRMQPRIALTGVRVLAGPLLQAHCGDRCALILPHFEVCSDSQSPSHWVWARYWDGPARWA
jgi:hypothetical protein